MVTSTKAARVEDRPNHAVSLSEMDGVVFNGDGRPFLNKARYQVVNLFDAGEAVGGYKTFADATAPKSSPGTP